MGVLASSMPREGQRIVAIVLQEDGQVPFPVPAMVEGYITRLAAAEDPPSL